MNASARNPSYLISYCHSPAGALRTSAAIMGSKKGRILPKDLPEDFVDDLVELEFQTLSDFARAAMLLPESAEVSSSFFETGFIVLPPRISNHCLSSSLSRTRYHSPASFRP